MSLVNDMLTDLDSRDENTLSENVLIDRQTNSKSGLEVKRPGLYLLVAFAIGVIGIWIGVQWQDGNESLHSDIYNLAVLDEPSTNQGILLEQGSIDRPALMGAGFDVNSSSFQKEKQLTEISVLGLGFGLSDLHQLAPDTSVLENEMSSPVIGVNGVNKAAVSAKPTIRSGINSTQGILLKAQQALAANKLTRPAGDNAFSLYQKILYSNPNNSEARLGIRDIAERYIAMADDLYLRGEWDRAKYYDNKASYVAGFYPEVEAWLVGINRPRTSHQNHDLSNQSVNDSLIETAKIKNAEHLSQKEKSFDKKDDPIVQNYTEQASSRLSSSLFTQVGAESSIKVERSTLADVEKRIRKAKSLLAQSQVALAETELLNADLTFPKNNEIKRLLFDVYVNSKRQVLARKTLDSMTGLIAHELAFLQSRVLVSENNTVAATEMLEKFSPNVNEAADFYRLLAALYQNQGRYAESANQYRKLISFDEKQATYWLGLAVSLDALSDEQGALQAFQWVRQYGIADREARAYVDQRIRSLSS